MVASAARGAEPLAKWGGWQDLRQQLFGKQRQREAQEALLAIFTRLQTRLGQTQGAEAGGPPWAPRARAAVLRAILDAANELALSHHEQVKVAPGTGSRHDQLVESAEVLLARVQHTYPLFEAAHAARGAIDCADLIDSVAQLRGAESDAFYLEALEGITFMLKECFNRLVSDDVTAPAALPLESTWAELLAEVEALG